MNNDEPQNALLTNSQRKFLRSNIQNTDNASTRRYRIRQRVRQGLNDFRVLAEELDDKDREMIFDADPGSRERYELSKDVAKAIQFMYVGLGGEENFRGSLKLGVANAEQEVGNIESTFHAVPRFEVDRLKQTQSDSEIIEAVHSGSLDSLESPDLYSFIRRAKDANAIDFEQITDTIEFDEDVVPPLDEQPDAEEWMDTQAEYQEILSKALHIGLK